MNYKQIFKNSQKNRNSFESSTLCFSSIHCFFSCSLTLINPRNLNKLLQENLLKTTQVHGKPNKPVLLVSMP